MSKNLFRVSAKSFSKIPGSPLAYWIHEVIVSLFNHSRIEAAAKKVCKGGFTGDNERFLRVWHEVSQDAIRNDSWHFYSKGGAYRKWYGNSDRVILWKNNGHDVKNSVSAGMGASKYYGLPHIVWSGITTYKPSFRCDDANTFFDDVSPAIVFSNESVLRYYICGYCNSIIPEVLLSLINPTFHFQAGDIKNLPLLIPSNKIKVQSVENKVIECVSISRTDWDSFETSWDFKCHPLVKLVRN